MTVAQIAEYLAREAKIASGRLGLEPGDFVVVAMTQGGRITVRMLDRSSPECGAIASGTTSVFEAPDLRQLEAAITARITGDAQATICLAAIRRELANCA